MSTRAEHVDAALSQFEQGLVSGNVNNTVNAAVEMARLLRESQPEPAMAGRCPFCGNVHDMTHPTLACPPAPPEPAAPAVGEDEALLARIDSVVQEYLLASLRTSQERAVHKMEELLVDLGTRLRAALSDMARLRSDIETLEHNARVGGLREEELERERDEARAALPAAVAEERDWWLKEIRIIKRSWPNHAMPILELEAQYRARAGRNDV